MAQGQRCSMLRMLAFGTMLALMLARSSNADSCAIDASNPEAMSCNEATEFGSTLYATTAAAQVASGLSYDFYSRTCPNYKSVVNSMVKKALHTDPLQAAGLVRIIFHDCFIQGCDASVLVNTSAKDEQQGIPNKTLRKDSLDLLNAIKAKLEKTCPKTVSCADIISLAAAQAIELTQGPSINMPLGRRDSKNFESPNYVLANLPSPIHDVHQNFVNFSAVGLDYADMVALTGAHTLGQAHCSSFSNRLRPTVDPELDSKLASRLEKLCPETSSNSAISLDSTPDVFDNNYFKQILTGDGVLTSDASFEQDSNTNLLVKKYCKNQSQFFSQFQLSLVKLSQINVLTGSAGEIRKVCSAVNGAQSY